MGPQAASCRLGDRLEDHTGMMGWARTHPNGYEVSSRGNSKRSLAGPCRRGNPLTGLRIHTQK